MEQGKGELIKVYRKLRILKESCRPIIIIVWVIIIGVPYYFYEMLRKD